MTSDPSNTKTRLQCRPLLRQALNTATLRHRHSLQQANDKDPTRLLNQRNHSATGQAIPLIIPEHPGQMPAHGLQIRERNRDDVIGSGMLGPLSNATITTPSDPRFGAVGSGRRLVKLQQGSIATAREMKQVWSKEHIGSDIGSRTTRGESLEVNEGTRIEEVHLAERLVADSARQLAGLKERYLGKTLLTNRIGRA